MSQAWSEGPIILLNEKSQSPDSRENVLLFWQNIHNSRDQEGSIKKRIAILMGVSPVEGLQGVPLSYLYLRGAPRRRVGNRRPVFVRERGTAFAFLKGMKNKQTGPYAIDSRCEPQSLNYLGPLQRKFANL